MASFLPYLLFDTNKNENNRESKDVIAVVKIDGEVVDKFNLSQVSESLEKHIILKKGNTILLK